MPERRMVDMLVRGGTAERGKWGKRRRIGRVQKVVEGAREERGWREEEERSRNDRWTEHIM